MNFPLQTVSDFPPVGTAGYGLRVTYTRPLRRAGFSLVELLVVMAIIGVMAVVALNSMKSPNDAHQLTGATATAASLFQGARSVAMTRNATVRVLINDDATNTEYYRRQIVTLVSELDADGNLVWRYDDKPFVLPTGVFFDVAHSLQSDGTPPTKLKMANAKFGDGPEWFCYTFAPNGASGDPGTRFVLAGGILDSGQIQHPNPQAVAGFVLRRSGMATMFRDASQIVN